MDQVQNQSATPSLAETIIFEDSFNRTRAMREAIAAADAQLLNVDIPTAVTILLSRVTRIKALEADIAKHAPTFDITLLDELAHIGRAAWHAHTLYQNTLKPPKYLQEVADLVLASCQRLETPLAAFVQRNLIANERVGELVVPNGYRAIADRTFAVVNIYRSHWDVMEGKTVVTEKELDEVERNVARLVDLLTQREEAAQAIAAAALVRQQAFTLMMNTWDEVRRVVTYVRWHEGDADEIAPTLYPHRPAKRKTETETAAKNASTATTPAAATTQTTPAVAPSKPGLPSNDPFAAG